ncbi:PREDICTED: uncharacterized protein LOC105360331 [Ceratosolen solmsi marchali]|uniref:Uncharacterized protein LOC105360331 n=1 Tax=Ceratosolen solmsi marchali TaxID=326594 RepID=A0AAJ6VMW6_9HYME|nr:PREDICTED: uncharacterized protein LOC105360331 [Ceratosolen solmsi marchali]
MESSESIDISSIEFTLEDTYEHLKDIKKERELEIQQLMNIIKNNEIRTLDSNITPEEIRYKRAKYVQSLDKYVKLEQPRDLPIVNTADFYTSVLKDLEDEVTTSEELNEAADEEIKELESDINYLENQIVTFKQMKEATLSTEDNETTNYKAEMIVIKRLFNEVKNDLEIVVDTLFPANHGFQELLCVLTRALSKGGDDLYIDVTPDTLDFINFLEEADIIQFHPHDKTKIKLMNM